MLIKLGARLELSGASRTKKEIRLKVTYLMPAPHPNRLPTWVGRGSVFLLVYAIAGMAASALGQPTSGYPSKSIRLISPFTPGGGASIVARLLSEPLTEAWKESVVVD